jgi:hypothetical protein
MPSWALYRAVRRIVGPPEQVGDNHAGLIVAAQPAAELAERIAALEEHRIRRAEEEIRQAAQRIDPYTARMFKSMERGWDPYRLGKHWPPPDPDLISREYFFEDPEGKWPVLVHDVRKLHPEIGDEEWEELMQAAAERTLRNSRKGSGPVAESIDF